MEIHIIDERTGIRYALAGDCYLRKHKHLDYELMLISGKLNTRLESIDRQKEDLLSRLVTDMAEQEDITEALKAADQIESVRCMNSIHSRAEEIVYTKIIHT